MAVKADEGMATRLGRILIDRRLISEAQLDAAIREQGRSGRRLGEILADMQLITRAQVRGAMRRQRNLRLAAGLATALLGPLQACAAASSAPAASPVLDARPFGDDGAHAVDGNALDRIVAGPVSAAPHDASSVRLAQADGVRMQALDDANALAVFQHAVATAQTIQQGARGALPAGVHLIGDLGKLFDPATRTLSVGVDVSQVSVEPGTAYATLGKDGMVTLRVQSSAGDISVHNLRVDGTAGADAGHVALQNIDLRKATVSIKPR